MATTGRTELYEEIDLRPYIEALLRSWMWIVGIAAVAAVATFGILSLPEPRYQATALVAVTKPRFNVQFDPRLQTIEDLGIGYGAYQEIAMSDELIAALLAELPFTPVDIESIDDFKNGMLSAQVEDNETLLFLRVTSSSPSEATEIANTWAMLIVERANQLYGNAGTEPIEFLETQLALAEADLVAAEIALVDFQARNNARILQSELASLVNQQQRHLNEQVGIDELLRDIEAFRIVLAQGEASEPLSQADQLTALSLQANIFNAPLENIQFDLSNDLDLLASNRAEVVADLENFSTMLAERKGMFDQAIDDLSPQILEIQEQLIELDNELARLNTELENSRDAKDLYSRSLEETQISSQGVGDQVKLAGRAIEPKEPMPRGRLTGTILTGVVVSVLAVAAVFTREWWIRRNDHS